MGSRGGGRGRGGFGRGGGGFRHAKQEPFVLFPEIKLTAIDKGEVDKGKELVYLRNKLQQEIKQMPYFLEETFDDEEEKDDIERHSNAKKRKGTSQVSLENSGYMTLQPGYFPLELVQGTKRRIGRKVQWNPKRDLKKLDILEERELNVKDEDRKDKKEGDEDDEEDVEEEEADVDSSSDDYAKGEEFEDDEDGFNDVEEEEEDLL